LKGKRNIEDVYQSPEPSLEEDHQTLSERLTHLQGQSAAARKKEKEKQSMEEEGTSPQHLRRSIRLRGKWRKAQPKGPHFIDLGGGTPKQPPTSRSPPHSQPNIETSPPDVDISPSRPDFEISPPQ